ncbi:MAG: transposase [Proteobacteria bacterium]|nr:transposase [Pseudomonadota bacterium]
MARLAALVPPPRMHLTRYHGVFAPHSKLRAAVTPAGRGKGAKPQAEEGTEPSSTPRHVAMSWAKRLKRVFGIDIEACARCGGKLKVIASIEEPQVIAKILAHLSARRWSRFSAGCRSGPERRRRSPVCCEFEAEGAYRLPDDGGVGRPLPALRSGRGRGGITAAGRGARGWRTVRRGSWPPDSPGRGLTMAGSGSP